MTQAEELRYDDKVIVITGGGGSLGGNYARLLASRGARVVVNDVAAKESIAHSTTAERVVQEIVDAGGEAIVNTSDAVEGAEQIVQAAIDAWGRLDGVVANAGIATGGTIDTIPVAEFERVADVTYRGTTRLMHHAWPHLRKTRGSAILTSSGSVFGGRFVAPYTSSKSAMIGLAKTLGMDGEADGIRVNAIMPTAWSQMTAGMPEVAFQQHLEEHYGPERVASAVAWLLHDSTAVTGRTFVVGAGFVGPVFLGVGWGWGSPDATPEDFRAHTDEILDIANGMFIPKDSGDEINFRSDRAVGHHVDSASLH